MAFWLSEPATGIRQCSWRQIGQLDLPRLAQATSNTAGETGADVSVATRYADRNTIETLQLRDIRLCPGHQCPESLTLDGQAIRLPMPRQLLWLAQWRYLTVTLARETLPLRSSRAPLVERARLEASGAHHVFHLGSPTLDEALLGVALPDDAGRLTTLNRVPLGSAQAHTYRDQQGYRGQYLWKRNMENRFNLIDEPWIQIADVGRVSLRDIFANPQYRGLGGNPVQKIAVFKLLQAIGQAACTPRDALEWQMLSTSDLAAYCQAYLTEWHARFFLYGAQPFLQVPAISTAECKNFGTVLAEIASGNTTVLTQWQQESNLDDAERAMLLLVQMGFALAGKKTDNSVVLSPGYRGKYNEKGKPSSGRAGPSIGFRGLLHSFVLGETVLDTVLLNLLTIRDIEDCQRYPGGVGRPPWEAMPTGEDCPIARAHRQSLQGRLLPLSRFCLLAERGLYYSEGIAHPDYKVGGIDPTVAIEAGKEPKALWVNPARRPWRELTALLSFLQGTHGGFECQQLRIAVHHARQHGQRIAIWSGGISISNKAGEQFMTGENDYVDSAVWFDARDLGTEWFANLRQEFESLNALAKMLYACVMGYYERLKVDGKPFAVQATTLFWQLCERHTQELIDGCNSSEAAALARRRLRRRFANNLLVSYGQHCSNETARQLDAWAGNHPHPLTHLQEDVA